jgi:hypothetical protein
MIITAIPIAMLNTANRMMGRAKLFCCFDLNAKRFAIKKELFNTFVIGTFALSQLK